jgi:hypothetical protein
MVGSGTKADPYTVDLPTWQGVEFDTDKGKKPPHAFAIVEVPDDELTSDGKLNLVRIKQKYKGQKWEKHIDEVDQGEKAPL